MKYIFKFIEYINETNILSWSTLILIISYLIYLYNKKEEVEKYLIFKLIGFYILGTFTFNFKYFTFTLPIGFIIYLLFMKNNERKNKITKKKATVFGFIIFCLSILNAVVYNKVEYRDRNIAFENIGVNTLKHNYEEIKKELGINNQVYIESFNLDYNENKIKRLNYTVKDVNNNKVYYISSNNKGYNVVVNKIYDNEDDSFMLNSNKYNLDTETLLDVVNNINFKENKSADYYTIIYRNGLNAHDDFENLYTIDSNDYSTKKLECEHPIYNVVELSHIPMKRVSEGSWESIRSDTYLINYSID